MKATFMQRLLAYILDILILSVILSFITIGLNSTKINDLSKELNDKISDITSIDENTNTEELTNEILELEYEIQKESVVVNIISLVTTFIYFIVFQYLNNGQTIGKKLLKIKIVDENNSKLGFVKMFFRCFIIEGLLSTGLCLVLLMFFKHDLYMELYYVLNLLTFVFTLVCALMILYRKDKCGLHDMMVRSKVVSEKNNISK